MTNLEERLNQLKFALLNKGFTDDQANQAMSTVLVRFLPRFEEALFFAVREAEQLAGDHDDESPTLTFERSGIEAEDLRW